VRAPGVLELCGPVGFVWGHRIIGTVKRGPRIPKKPIELGIRGRTPALQDDLHVSVRASWVPGWGNSTCSFLLKIGKLEIQKHDEWKPTRVGAGSTTWVGHRVPSPCIRDTVSRPRSNPESESQTRARSALSPLLSGSCLISGSRAMLVRKSR
jgi:hypothetical protein